MATILVIAFSGTSDSGAADGTASSASRSPSAESTIRVPAPEKCSAHKAVRFYAGRIAYWRSKTGVGRTAPQDTSSARPASRASCPRYLASVLKRRAAIQRKLWEVWLVTRTLRDYPFVPGNHAWHRAVREVQRVFPGTEGWLLSCSGAEGGHGRWVGYSGVAYSTRLRDSDTVGGPLQMRFSTFTGMFRRGAEYARAKGYRIPTHLRDMTAAWRSALGQAIAGGWARYTGNDNEHWRASWGRGC